MFANEISILNKGDHMNEQPRPSQPPQRPARPAGTTIPDRKPTPPVSDAAKASKELLKELDNRGIDIGDLLLQKLISRDGSIGGGGSISKGWLIAISVIVSLFTIIMLVGSIWVSSTINRMNDSYMQQTTQIIFSKSEIDSANSWERLPPSQKKEKLREQYYAIIRYYTNSAPYGEKMTDDQILQSFNQMWLATERLTTVNFFFPVAFMKAMTNFNPYYNANDRLGMGYFYLNNAEQIANLNIVRNDPVFMVEYKGSASLSDPIDTIKLLVARIDDLSKTFNGREDWIFLALITNEYDVISRYWNGGSGSIPDDMYIRGPLADCLKYYHSFKNWQIPQIGE